MENIIIKRKTFENIIKVGENTFIGTLKDKKYFIRLFNDIDQLDDHIYNVKRLSSCGINVPKIIRVDKKSLSAAFEYIEGINMLDLLVKDIPSEEQYKAIFLLAWYAKGSKMSLSFKPDNFIYKDNKMYYLSTKISVYNQNNDFTHTDIRLWFPTKELAAYALKLNKDIKDIQIGDEYKTNKKIVLTTCQYYR